MDRDDIIGRCMEHKHALIFVGGIATALIGQKILESKQTKDLAAQAMAKVLTCKSELEESIQDIKDNAEDIHTDAVADKKDAVVVDTTAE
ncbi:DUF6110 family protein [uncultured Methanobrevibacter sp.]|uniref:DUF6110 family protein n=1 Tax=uncultured Methanobrevibacter sp. TaxID=253161 RepID=UPI0025CC2935|nr:DUF6110 family protein [uncultured Methanobrevibacter sp.]